MRRHRVLAVVAAFLILFASQAQGQQPVHRVGFLGNTENPEATQAWLEGLREHGYVIGKNLQIEYRYSQAQNERIPALVAELVALAPEVIVTAGPQLTAAVHAAAPTIPLVFINVAPCCMDRRCGRTEPDPCSGSCDADILRASQLQHSVQHVGSDRHLDRLSPVRLRTEPITDDPFPSRDVGLHQGAPVVP